MKYSIGEFAQIIGVTVDTLRLYEKYGIIEPFKDDKNNYRYFDDLDARNLLISRWYRSMDIPLQEVSILTKSSSLESITDKLRDNQLRLEAEIERSTRLLNKITEINKDISKIKTSLNKCEEKSLRGIYRLKQTYKNTLLKNEEAPGNTDIWMELLPYTFFSFIIEKEGLLSEEDSFEYNWGLAIYEEDLCNFDIKLDENVEYIGSQSCVSAIIPSYREENIMKDSLKVMMDYINKRNYRISGDIIGKIILTEKVGGGKNRISPS